MIRTLWFILQVAVVIAAAGWLYERPGTVTISWQGWLVETSVGMATAGALVGLVAVALLYRFWRALRTAPGRWKRAARARTRERGYRALTQGMVAVAAGDAAAATRCARQADVLLNEPPLTMLLAAQAAQLNGDENAAGSYFRAMLDRPETAFLGVRGLLTQALKRGDPSEALLLARRADGLQPRTPWVLGTLWELEARAGEWAAAERTLQAAVQAGAVAYDTGKHRQAAILVERSLDAEQKGRADAALAHAMSAHETLPGFAPAASRLALLLIKAGKHKQASKTIEQAWKIAPHPLLVEAYLAVLATHEPRTRLDLMAKLAALKPGDVEGALAMARACLAAERWDEARSHAGKALALENSRRVLKLTAEIEIKQNGEGPAARDWLVKAAAVTPGPTWVCCRCGATRDDWHGLCHACGNFDTLEWKVPAVAQPVMALPPVVPVTISTLPPGAGALPVTRAPVMVEG